MSANEIRSAFPWVSHGGVSEHQVVEGGLTKREYFAAMALNGLTSNITEWVSEEFFSKYAEQAFSFAEAMISESER
jgi:hypothetical protein